MVPGSPAALAGMQNDDHVIEVEGTNVEHSPHDKVVQVIKGAGDEISLLLSSQRSFQLRAKMQMSTINAGELQTVETFLCFEHSAMLSIFTSTWLFKSDASSHSKGRGTGMGMRGGEVVYVILKI